MTFRDWVSDTHQRFEEQPAMTAAKVSMKKFWRGIVRRTLDPYVGRSIWERNDWDVCLVLDAARVDLMREAVLEYDNLPDEVGAVWSNASCSIDWIDRQFNGHPEEAQQTGYVTGNPFASHDEPSVESADLSEKSVGHLELLYKTEWQDIGGGIQTVPPEAVSDHAIDVWRRREELGIDQLVVHYMQPHEPFRSRPEWVGDHKLLDDLVNGETAGASVFPRVESGDVPLEEFREVYLDNHHWVLKDVTDRLLGNLDGEIAITADHGNGLGEWGSWHHPPATIAPPVRRVPWLRVSSDDEHTVTPDLRKGENIEASTDEQLEALGYL